MANPLDYGYNPYPNVSQMDMHNQNNYSLQKDLKNGKAFIDEPSSNVIKPKIQFQSDSYGSDCYTCKKKTLSERVLQIGQKAYIMCFIFFFFTGVCFWLPFVLDNWKQEKIICKQCKGYKPQY